jgi:gluconate:H+ symporter, GntP family
MIFDPVAPGWQLVTAALGAITLLILLITVLKVHPFIALVLGGFTVGAIAGQSFVDTVNGDGDVTQPGTISIFATGFGNTAADVGILIALGAMFAKLLADSGGASQIVDTLISRTGRRSLPWAMAAAGALVGLPMFFEIGLVLLMPIIYLVARRAQVSLIVVGIPALAGLSAMHGFIPPHPGPVIAVDNLGANLGVTLALGLVVAVPTIIVAGPLFGILAGRWVDIPAPDRFDNSHGDETDQGGPRPSFGITLVTVLLPVVLMLGKAIADVTIDDTGNRVQQVLDAIGEPFVALLISVLVAMVTLGRGAGMGLKDVSDSVASGLPGIAGILLIVCAGGGFKEVLVETGIGTLLARWADNANISVLLLAWVIAVLIRLATGSATIATITASTLVTQLVVGMSTGETSLVVLAVGAGSLFFSHVNDAGFWLVKEYFGMSVGQTIKSWSLMETVLSVTGLVMVLFLGIFI